MAEIQSSELQLKRSPLETGDLPTIDGGLLNDFDGEKTVLRREASEIQIKTNNINNSRLTTNYIFLPLLFLTVALFGGWRLSAADNAFIFLKPALVCLIFAGVLLILFFRANLLRLDGWFSENFSTLKNVANATVLITLFAASTQVFNALLPERGLPFWIVAFCFFWTLWNNLFAEFEVRKLLQSLGGLFGLAFVVKYLVLANLAAPANATWWRAIIENPAQATFTWVLYLPRFAAGTGYVQFFTVIFYLAGLFLLPSTTAKKEG